MRMLRGLLMAAVSLLTFGGAAAGDPIPSGWTASNMHPIGYTDLDGRDAFKLAIKEVGGRWYLYMGHLWSHGWSIVDVTDPTDPKYLKFIPGPDNTWTIQMTLHDNLMITALQKSAPRTRRSRG